MNKKLLAVAVAGALAAPGVALAEGSSVTVEGFFRVGVENYSVSGTPANTRLNRRQNRLSDDASRINFGSKEDLGNGLYGIMYTELRIMPHNDVGDGPVGAGLDGGETYVGLKSDSWGELTLGRRHLHYIVATLPFDNTAFGPGIAGALQAVPTSLMDYAQASATTAAASTNKEVGVGSQKGVVKWQSPVWNGFSTVVGWSAAVGTSSGDMTAPVGGVVAGTVTRKGDAWNIAPSYVNGPLGIGWSYWRNKYDAPVAGVGLADQRADTVWGYYKFGNGFKIGLGFNRIKLDDATGAGQLAKRDAWTIPASYTWGPHVVSGNYTVAGDSDNAAGNMTDTGARMFAIVYSYSFSKRTQIGLTYAKINNDRNANYELFTNQYGFGSNDANLINGESPRMLKLAINHSF